LAKVVLLDSPSWSLFNPLSFLHLGILYLAESVRRAGHEVKVLDCHQVSSWDKSSKQLIIHHEKLEPCDILGISATTANVHWGKMLAKAWPAEVKVLGGSHATYILNGPHDRYKRKSYFDGFDFCIVEEAEETFVEFCNGWDEGDVSKTPNLCWFNEFGLVQHGQVRAAVPDVAKLAPAFDLWPTPFYRRPLYHRRLRRQRRTGHDRAALYRKRLPVRLPLLCADARTKIQGRELRAD
jgi:radical SAM superfamily enzyme YgiQ (UPF0313 family)